MNSATAEVMTGYVSIQPVISPCAGSRQRSCSAYSCIKAKADSAGQALDDYFADATPEVCCTIQGGLPCLYWQSRVLAILETFSLLISVCPFPALVTTATLELPPRPVEASTCRS